jgi:hypothetical protein
VATARPVAVTLLPATLLAAMLLTVVLGGCGLAVQAPDLFAVTRTGAGKSLTMLVNYAGTVRCNGAPAKTLPDSVLLVARDLVGQLGPDARRKLNLPSPPGSVYRFKVRLQAGTVSFPDTAAARHPTLAQLEQFVLQAQQACGAGS